MRGMAKEKVTITLDRSKAEAACSLLGTTSTSQTIELALERVIKAERLRRDIEAYNRMPQTDEELAIAAAGYRGGLEDDTDWEALYAKNESYPA